MKKYTFLCQNGHIFNMLVDDISDSTFTCPVCGNKNIILTKETNGVKRTYLNTRIANLVIEE